MESPCVTAARSNDAHINVCNDLITLSLISCLSLPCCGDVGSFVSPVAESRTSRNYRHHHYYQCLVWRHHKLR
ncbi:hypothetical protein JOB18_048283 [Solea senegalensis]|nr:hypothetical protein JOB18_048283 [Solea senegalensis]